ncbi:polymorphic toxin type 50 domain-containing protein [Enterococcus sp. DIV1420a]|uniref:polymorphic toxin type 50 domain-containing protein n=1 Tax=Enterococcus sp. DIV1420a TaxID=2774672 RepID=UPI003F6827DF
MKRLKDILGEGYSPKSLEEYQEIKYNDSEGWEQLKDNYFVKSRLKDGRYGSVINPEKQAPHMKLTVGKGKSYFNDDVDVQDLFDKYAGTGNVERNRTGRSNKEIVYAKDFEGIAVNQGNEIKTNYFKIHYSKKRTHIVPYEGRNQE